jgi:predicted GTPase
VGAAGRDFHNFNTVYRGDPTAEVVAFTAAQIAGVDGRRYPPSLAGPLYPEGIPIVKEVELEALCRAHSIDEVVFAYGNIAHEHVMHNSRHRDVTCAVEGQNVAIEALQPDRYERSSFPVQS